MNKKIVGGCCGLIALAIVAVIVFVSVAGPRAFQKGKKWVSAQIDDAKHRTAIESAWKPPAAKPDASWFPAAVEKWTLSISEDITTVPDLQLDRPGRRGKYRGEKQDIEVLVLPVSELEREGIFSQALAALQTSHARDSDRGSSTASIRTSRSSSLVTTRTPMRVHAVFNGDDHTRLWWLKDWLFIFRTIGPEDPGAFADKFLQAMTPPELEKRQ